MRESNYLILGQHNENRMSRSKNGPFFKFPILGGHRDQDVITSCQNKHSMESINLYKQKIGPEQVTDRLSLDFH